MLSKSEIESNLDAIESKYDAANGVEALLYSKLALLELCGWIEMGMDDLMKRCADHSLTEPRNVAVIDKVIKDTYGFSYDKHFRKMLCLLIGLVNFEKIELNANQQKILNFKSTLGNLKGPRDSEAHTFIEHTRRIDAPSTTKTNLRHVYDGLLEFEIGLKNNSLLP